MNPSFSGFQGKDQKELPYKSHKPGSRGMVLNRCERKSMALQLFGVENDIVFMVMDDV